MTLTRMALSFVFGDEKLASTLARFVSFFLLFFLHSCGRPELHQSSDRARCTIEELGGGNTISPPIVRYDLSPFTEPDGDSRGPYGAERAAMHQTSCLMRLLSPSLVFGRMGMYIQACAGWSQLT